MIKKLRFPSVRGAAIFFLGLFLCAWGSCMFPQAGFPERELVILSYNVENLFDDVRQGTEYPDYDPETDSWNTALYHAKMMNLGEVISSVRTGGADIVLLQEVENLKALEDLNKGYLKGLNYRYLGMAETPGAAVNVGYLSRVPVLSVRSHQPVLSDTGGTQGEREILEIVFGTDDKQLHIFNNHWKSKSGGAELTEPRRRASALALRFRIDEILRHDPDAFIIIAGDLNENSDEYLRIDQMYPTALMPYDVLEDSGDPRDDSIWISGGRPPRQGSGNIPVFFSPWLAAPEVPGSYLYQGNWETIDHFLLSESFSRGGTFSFRDFRVVRDDYLLTSTGAPRRWSSLTATGYSDHLPILLLLEMN